MSVLPVFPLDEVAKRDALLLAVETLREIIDASGEEGDALRQVPDKASASIRDAGLVLLKTPEAAGGAEATMSTQMDVIERVSYLSSAAGWCLLNNSNLLGMVSANLPDDALTELFAGETLPVPAGGGGMIPGQLEAVEGGFLLTGQWSWGSGIAGADWIVVPGALKEAGDQPARVFSCVFPRTQAKLIDNWHVMGLRGTGSCDFAVEREFIPARFTYPHRLSGEQRPPRRGGPLYRLDLYSYTSPVYVALLGGIARRAMDEVAVLAENKSRRSSASLASRSVFQRKLAEADIRLRGLRALAVSLAEQAFDIAATGNPNDPTVEADIRAVGAMAARTAAEAAGDAFNYAGGSGIWSGHILERCLRDLSVAGTHIWVSDVALEEHGANLIRRHAKGAVQ